MIIYLVLISNNCEKDSLHFPRPTNTPKPKESLVNMRNGEEKQQIKILKKLESANIWHLYLKNDKRLMDYQMIEHLMQL